MEFHPQLPAELLSQQFGHSLLVLATCPSKLRTSDLASAAGDSFSRMLGHTRKNLFHGPNSSAKDMLVIATEVRGL